MLFCICVIAKQYLYVSFIFLIFGTKGLSFIPAMTLKPRLFILMCLLTFCMFNFKAVKRRIKHDKLVRRLFHICLFFIFSMAFSIIYWNLSIVSVLNAGLPFLLTSSTVVFLPMTYKEYRKLFNIVFYITFVASILYISFSVSWEKLCCQSLGYRKPKNAEYAWLQVIYIVSG